MTPASADASARPSSSRALSLPSPRQSPRKVRSDAGIAKGPRKPPQPIRGTLKDDHWEIPLRGKHGLGKVLKVDREDYELLMEMSERGTYLYVVPDISQSLTVRIGGKGAACFSANDNPEHRLPVTRFLTGERHKGLVLRHINHDPMDCRRANLIHEVKAKKTRHPIDWEKAQRKREERMEVVRERRILKAFAGDRLRSEPLSL